MSTDADIGDLFDDDETTSPVVQPVKTETSEDHIDALFGDDDEAEENPTNQAGNESDDEINNEDDEISASGVLSHTAIAQGEPLYLKPTPAPPIPDSNEIAIFSLPNVVAIDDVEFNPETFDERREELKETLSDTRARVTDGYRNVIRWRSRIDPDGTTHVESNARLVRWPDGLTQLHVGDEVFVASSSHAEANHPSYLYGEAAPAGLLQPLGIITKRTKLSLADLRSRTHQALKAVIEEQARVLQRGTGFSYDLSDTRKAMAEASAAVREAEAKAEKARRTAGGVSGYGTHSHSYEDMLEYASEPPHRVKKDKKEKKEKKHKKEKKDKRDRLDSEEEQSMDDFIGDSEEDAPAKRRRMIDDEE